MRRGLLVLFLLRNRVPFSGVGDAEVVIGVRSRGRRRSRIRGSEKCFLRLLTEILREECEPTVELHRADFGQLPRRFIVCFEGRAVLLLGHQGVALLGVRVLTSKRAPSGCTCG
jgi:hypothetical protein